MPRLVERAICPLSGFALCRASVTRKMVLDISVFLLSVSVLVLVTAATLRRDLTPIPRRAQQRKYLHQQDAVQDVTHPVRMCIPDSSHEWCHNDPGRDAIPAQVPREVPRGDTRQRCGPQSIDTLLPIGVLRPPLWRPLSRSSPSGSCAPLPPAPCSDRAAWHHRLCRPTAEVPSNLRQWFSKSVPSYASPSIE